MNNTIKGAMNDAKRAALRACSAPGGTIAALAIDQRGSLKKALSKHGIEDDAALGQFKEAVTEVLSPLSSAVLLDPLYGLAAAARRHDASGLILAYEHSGYDDSSPGRLPLLLDGWSAHRLAEAGADAVKLLLYYNPQDDNHINTRKEVLVERVGAECAALNLAFFLEPLTYDDSLPDRLSFARVKPRYVRDTAAEFSKPHYRVDVLKLEFPLEAAFAEGLAEEGAPLAYRRADALELVREAGDAAGVPFIYLSAGVSMQTFIRSLELAAEADAKFSGVLCGRATWQGGIAGYARGGEAGLRAWLEDEGRENILRLNEAVAACATPWT